MKVCNLHHVEYSDLQLRKTDSEDYVLACPNYRSCEYFLPSNFDPSNLSEKEIKISRVFDCFVSLNSFLHATFGILYFNLDDYKFVDYLLKSDVIREDKSLVEVGPTGSKIFFALFHHLYLIPNEGIRIYLQRNFPENYSQMLNGQKAILFADVDYSKNMVNETRFEEYKDYYQNY